MLRPFQHKQSLKEQIHARKMINATMAIIHPQKIFCPSLIANTQLVPCHTEIVFQLKQRNAPPPPL